MGTTNGKTGPLWSRLDRRAWIAIAAVLAVALVGGVVALAGRAAGGKDADMARQAEATATPTGTPSPASPGSAPSGSAAAARPGAPTKAPGPKPPGDHTPATMAGRPTEPMAKGSTLTTITAPPEKTLALLDPKKVPADAQYSVEFSPYGYAPSAPTGPKRIVIKILGSRQTGGKDCDLILEARNMLALLNSKDPITLGGTYDGRLLFQPQGDVLVPVLENVSAVK